MSRVDEQNGDVKMGRNVLLVLVVTVAFFGARFQTQAKIDKAREGQVQKEVSRLVSEFDEVASKPVSDGEYKSEKMLDWAEAGSSKQFNELDGVYQKRDFALGALMGVYLVNQIERKDYCQKLGVDISPFTNALMDAHAAELLLARKHVFKSQAEEDRLIGMLRPTWKKMIDMEMDNASKMYQLPHKEICNAYRDLPDEIVSEMLFSKMQPRLYQAIHIK